MSVKWEDSFAIWPTKSGWMPSSQATLTMGKFKQTVAKRIWRDQLDAIQLFA